MKKNNIYFLVLGVLVLVGGFYFFQGGGSNSNAEILINPEIGEFEISVVTTGELRAKNSTNILGPMNMWQQRIHQIKISKLVPEGTVVKKGDFVAQLDRNEVVTKIQETQLNLQKAKSELENKQLDTTLTLSQAREELINLKYTMEEKKLEMEQSIYEPPAQQRKNEINFEKAKMGLERSTKNYQTKVQQAITNLKIAQSEITKEKNKQDELNSLLQQLTVIAPENGMVIYSRNWEGQKKVEGSMVNSWMPEIATLPDLSIMESVTYVNEVDIQKITTGLEVKIFLDAMPGKELQGKVTKVANIGEQLKNSDSKVFEVVIQIFAADSTLRPAMTTENRVEIESFKEKLFIPLETVHWEDTISFVYVKAGGRPQKKEVKCGKMNDIHVVVEEGLKVEDMVFLNIPQEAEGLELKREN